ncbi:amino acid adenylation domain-containing protein [Streptomyces sp. NPDC052301]|uniref:amino acid adenylation domain-containing protein n=1 Tax=Streptomyces sp. NPDC052301 TaxID=3365687 RepID=UPI0037D12B9C
MAQQTLYDWFAAGARSQPEAVALEVAGHRLRYAELRDAVDRLAGRVLAAHGGRPQRVGLLASRSLAAYTGYLAALRLGAAVVPLNPVYPPARNAMICTLGQVDVLIVDDSGAGQLAGIHEELGPVTTLRLQSGADGELLTGAVPDLPPPPDDPDGLAYVLFTSGSTGTPKGVPLRHRNLHAYLALNIARYEAGPDCRFSQTFDLTFDPSVLDLFVCWGSGATLVVPRAEELMRPLDFITSRGITHWSSVPSLISVADRLGTLVPGAMPQLRWSLFIGEQLLLDKAAIWAAAAPASTVENCYGPTEMTITCTAYRLPRDVTELPRTGNGTVPIGPPYPHLEHLVLDEQGNPAEEGELCLRGPQRFGGYLDPKDDVERFHAFDGHRATPYDGSAPLTGEHWYRTGDRVRREHGQLVHVGRLDQQIKMRGYRIELGEIEEAVRSHGSVEDAVVLALPAHGETALVAVYTGEDVPTREFLKIIRTRLPMYMLPQRFHHVPALPLNANGKIDRRRLAEEFASRAGGTARGGARR